MIARENGFVSWSRLKADAEIEGYSRAQKQQRLIMALFHGQNWVVERLLDGDPDLEADMLEIARLLLDGGADVNDVMFQGEGLLSALFGALGHANNVRLAEYFLEVGADPNDGESLYHSTELGHRNGVRLLLEHGAKIVGKNAFLRAMDFNDAEMLAMMLEAELPKPEVLKTALFHGAKRMCGESVAQLLLDNGANPASREHGTTAKNLAQIYNNSAFAAALGPQEHPITREDQKLIQIARGENVTFENPPALEGMETLLADLFVYPSALPHLKNLVRAGLDWTTADDMASLWNKPQAGRVSPRRLNFS